MKVEGRIKSLNLVRRMHHEDVSGKCASHMACGHEVYHVLYYDYWAMPLPELKCKQNHMLKSIVWILLNNEMWGREIERSRKERKRERQIKQKIATTLEFSGVRWSSFTLGFSVVGGLRSLKTFHCLYISSNKGINAHWLHTSFILLVK